MSLIDELFYPKAPGPLYHYTGIRGLLGIVNTRSVWASHVYYLNDASEIIHAIEVMQWIVKDVSSLDLQFDRQLIEWLTTFRGTQYQLFVFSLSEKRNLLSQWRSYTPHGKGVSVGFSPATIEAILAQPEARLVKCQYDRNEQKESMFKLLRALHELFRERGSPRETIRTAESQSYYPFFEQFRGDLLQILATIKHSEFSEEVEWRILSPYLPNYAIPEIKFREGASMLVPYIEIPLPNEESVSTLFDEVVLGPSQDINLSINALSTFLSNRGVCTRVGQSGIPYRNW